MTNIQNEKNDKYVLKRQDAPFEVIIVDPITLPIAKLLARMKVHPLVVTALAFLSRVCSAIFFSQGILVAGATFAVIGFFLDGIDGKIARIRRIDEELHGTVDFLLDQVSFAIMGIGGIVWLTGKSYSIETVLLSSWLGFYMILMSFTSTWFRLLSQHGLVYKWGIGEEIYRTSMSRTNGKMNYFIKLPVNIFFRIRQHLAKFRITPYFGAIESEIVVFMIAPLFGFKPLFLILGIIFLLPDIFITLFLVLLRVIHKRV